MTDADASVRAALREAAGELRKAQAALLGVFDAIPSAESVKRMATRCGEAADKAERAARGGEA